MIVPTAKLVDARARLKRGASLDATADAVGVPVAALRAALAPKLVPVCVAPTPSSVVVVVVAGPLRIEGLSIEDIARLVHLCSG